MFERRLKIFLMILAGVTCLLLVRAAQLQVFGVDHWRQQAVESMRRPRQLETTRGRILDRKGEELAVDQACIDACVDFRAITDPPDAKWVRQRAIDRLTQSLGQAFLGRPVRERTAMIDEEVKVVLADIDAMWGALARESGRKLEEVEEARLNVRQRVEMRRRVVWYARYRKALREHADKDPGPWYRRWLIDDTEQAPELDHFLEDVAEQEEAHPIVRDISNETLITLKKNQERYPGLVLRPGVRRRYPWGEVAAHTIGRIGRVTREDLKADPYGPDDPRSYQYNDFIGRTGIEALAEPTLRGSRGRVDRVIGEDATYRVVDRVDPEPGRDVRVTIDVKLQRDIEQLFKEVRIPDPFPAQTSQTFEMHGAAVVIDVASGGALALASYPTYDLNTFEDQYMNLVRDDVNQPLLNRATQWAIEPGSTVKPVVGLGGIAEGVVGVDETIECTGYLMNRRGQPIRQGFRCWTASKFGNTQYANLVAHHQIPVPHPTGKLTFDDGLERSCNVYFETVADRLGMDGLRKWYDRFGLGRPTGLGIAESWGRLPSGKGLNRTQALGTLWWAGIGQGQVAATPIQMANISATIARQGVWMRPRLVTDSAVKLAEHRPSTNPTSRPATPDRVDLNLPPAAVAAAKQGMVDVIYSDAGTANSEGIIRRHDMVIAGKTGTAQAAPFRTPVRNAFGEIERDADGRVKWNTYTPSSTKNPNGSLPWYRAHGQDGKSLNHAWFIGFAPAEKPVIAFAVMVEYGGSGGHAAASVANGAIAACIRHGYIKGQLDEVAEASRE